jgi:hypothetical protein
MRQLAGRLFASMLAITVIATLTSCGSAIKRDAKRLKSRCEVVQGTQVSEEQARCIAKLYGIKQTKSCPLEVDRSDDFGQPAFRIRESCSGVGVFVAESTGRVLAVLTGVD